MNDNIKVGICRCKHRCAPPTTYKTIILKPNCVCGHNTLTQEMLSEKNIKYVIKYDFTLDDERVVVPENCILEFDGGSLKNGTIVGQDTLFINVGDVEIWGKNLVREGTWIEKQGGDISDKEYDPEHFSGLGRKTLKLKDGSNVLTQEDFDKANTIYVIPSDFDLNGETVEIPADCILEFEGGSISNGYINITSLKIKNGSLIDVIATVTEKIIAEKVKFVGGPLNASGTAYDKALLTLDNATYVLIENCEFVDGRLGLYADSCSNICVKGTRFENFTYWGNYFRSGTNLVIQNNICINVNDGIKLTGLLENVFISDNDCYNNVRDGIDFAGHSVKNCAITNNFLHDNTICGIEFKSLDRQQYPLSKYNVQETDLYFIDIDISKNTITNNVVGISSFSYYGTSMGVRLDRIKFVENTISNYNNPTRVFGMHIGFGCKQANGVSISYNHLQGQFDTAIVVSNGRYNTICGNIINNDNTGIRIDSQEYDENTILITVINNIITTYRQPAITLFENVNIIYILNNTLKTSQVATISNNSGGSNIVMFNNEPADYKRVVTTAQMSSLSSLLNVTNIGFCVYNTDYNKPMWWSGNTSLGTNGWVDAFGNPVDTAYPKVIGTPIAGNLAKFNSTDSHDIEDAGVAPNS